MSKLNTIQTPHSAVTSTGEVTTTQQGGVGYIRDAKSELFLLAVSNMVGEDTFYEGKSERDKRFRDLVRSVAVDDPDWTRRLIGWLRNSANMRTGSIVAAAEAAYALRDAKIPGGRQIVDAAISRADEPGELLAYCLNRYGRKLPLPIKKGVADAVERLFTEYNYLKWDSDARAVRMADVVELVHPSAKAAWQGDLYKHMLGERHGRGNEIPESLAVLRSRAALMAVPVERRRSVLGDSTRLSDGGMTWESLAGWLRGPMDREAWEAMIPSMGYMALLRNLRNFDDAKVSDAVAQTVCAKLADPEQVAKSRQLPLRFVSAYKAAPSLRWAWALEQAVNLSLANVPRLDRRSLILVDRSGSMFGAGLSARSTLDNAEAAALFGSALALRANNADLVQFGATSIPVPFRTSDSLLKMPERFTYLGGTATMAAVQTHFAGHNRVIIITDEQYNTWSGGYIGGRVPDVGSILPPSVPLYTWNLAGYRAGQSESGGANRHTFGGLSDAAFTMLGVLESHREGGWPF
ncbi:MAG TPA: TROVE domain-containing protein [Acidothermaceae bacterium]